MTVKELLEILNNFIENDFAHLRARVDRMIWIILTGLVSIIAGLIVLLIK